MADITSLNATLKNDPKFQALLKAYNAAKASANTVGQIPTDPTAAYNALRNYATSLANAQGVSLGPSGNTSFGADGGVTNLDTNTGQFNQTQDPGWFSNSKAVYALPLAAGTLGYSLTGLGAGAAADGIATGAGASGAGATGAGAGVVGTGAAATGAGATGGAAAAGGAAAGGGALSSVPWSQLFGAAGNIGSALIQSNAAGNASEAQAAAAKYAADLQAKAAADTLGFEKDQAGLNQSNYVTAQNSNYDQWLYRQGLVRPYQSTGLGAENTLAQMLGLPAINTNLPNTPARPTFQTGTPPPTMPFVPPS